LYQRTGAVCRRTSKEQLDWHLDLVRRKKAAYKRGPVYLVVVLRDRQGRSEWRSIRIRDPRHGDAPNFL
jgi:hypothetical protein